MIVYHMSQMLKLGEKMKNDFEKKAELTLPFVQALEKSIDYFYDVVIHGQSKRMVPEKLIGLDHSDYMKWCVEGVFEFVRKTEFPDCPSRMNCKYFFDTLENFKILYEAGWKQESEEERAKIHLYEIELDDVTPKKFDMVIYDEAFDAMAENQDVETVLSCARRYFSKAHSAAPVWEVVSDQSAQATKDITDRLRNLIEE